MKAVTVSFTKERMTRPLCKVIAIIVLMVMSHCTDSYVFRRTIGFRFHSSVINTKFQLPSTIKTAIPSKQLNPDEITPKKVTNEIMVFFNERNVSPKTDLIFKKRLAKDEVKKNIDGLHIITILFQSARSRRMAKDMLPPKFMYDTLKRWTREWTERDISMFVYGVRSLDGLDPFEGRLLMLAAKRIQESKAELSSRAIGNALYGLQDITSDTVGAPALCAALANKIALFNGDLNGQDIGIGIYGLQGMSGSNIEIRRLVGNIAKKISISTCELDSQAMSNAMYGLQSMSSDYPEVLKLVSALAVKVSESTPNLPAQAIGSALYGLQKLSSDKVEVRM